MTPCGPERSLTALVLTVTLSLLGTTVVHGQGAQTAVLQIRFTLVETSSRCSVSTRARAALPDTGATSTGASSRTTNILNIRCGAQAPGSEKLTPPSVFASGQISISRTGASLDAVTLTLRSIIGSLPEGSWTGARPLVSYRAAPAGAGAALINVEY